MDDGAPTGIRRRGPRRWLRRTLILILISPPLAFGLSNLLLASPWACNWFAAKLSSRTTLETSIDSASWSPWNGLTFRGLTMLQPEPLRPMLEEPLVRIQQLRVLPIWKSLLKKQLEIQEVSLLSPEVVLPVEILSYLAEAGPPSAAVQPPPTDQVAQQPPLPAEDLLAENLLPPQEPLSNPGQFVEPPPPSVPSPEAPAPPEMAAVPPPAPTSPAGPTTPPPAVEPQQADHVSPEPAEAAPPPSDTPKTAETPRKPAPAPSTPSIPTGFAHLENASFKLILASSKTPILGSSGIHGKIPIGGDPASSSITIGSLDLLGNQLLEKAMQLSLGWRFPVITMTPKEQKLGELNTRLTCQLAMAQGIPISLNIQAPEQPLANTPLPGSGSFSSPAVSGEFQFRGQLLFPATWQANLVIAAAAPSVDMNGQITKFDEAQSLTTLRSGALSCVDARIIGDHLSILGNATVLADGRTGGVVRIVAPPETTIGIVNQLFPGLTAPPAFSSMSTPQRVALDIEASGRLGDIQIRLGKNGPLIGQPKPPATLSPP